METVTCNLCGHNKYHAVYQVKDTNYGQPGIFSLVQCGRCDLVYLNPRPTAKEIGGYYPTEQYHPFRALSQAQAIHPAPRQQARADKVSQIVNPATKRRALDVGTGSGLFLMALQARGWHVYGVEPNAQAVTFAQTVLNLSVVTGDIFAVEQDARFDLISFWDVLEHTHTPHQVLDQAYRLLNPEGVLAISVPNWASWERRIFKESWIAIDAPRHLFHFTPKTVAQLLQVCGFDIINMRTNAPVMSPASNLLRVMGSWLRWAKRSAPSERPAFVQVQDSMPKSSRKGWLIRATYLMLTIPNLLANLAGRGGSITVYARRKIARP